MNENYRDTSFDRLKKLWIKQETLEADLTESRDEKSRILEKALNSGTRKDWLASKVIRRKMSVQKMLDRHNLKRDAMGDYPLSVEDAEYDSNLDDGIEIDPPARIQKIAGELELKAEDREPYQRLLGKINSLRVAIDMTRFEITDILNELGLRDISVEDLGTVKDTVANGQLENYRQLVQEIAEKISRKVAMVVARIEEKKYLPLQKVPDGEIERLSLPMSKMLGKPSENEEDGLTAKAGEFNQRVSQIANIALNKSFNTADKIKALRSFRMGVSDLFQPDKIHAGLSDFLVLFRTMESTPKGKKLLEEYDLTQLFDMSNPIIMLGVAVHYSKSKLDYKKMFAVRKLMVAEESTMTKEDWVKLFKTAEDLELDKDPEWPHFVGVLVQQFINTAIYTAAQEGDYAYFKKGDELMDSTLFADHRPEEPIASARVLLDIDQIFSYVPDRVQTLFEAVRDYNPTLFSQIMMSFYENGIWFRAIKRGRIKEAMRHLWGKKTAKMSDLVERLLAAGGVYENGNLLLFKDRYYGKGIAPTIAKALAASQTDAALESNLLPAADLTSTEAPASEAIPSEVGVPSTENPFDI